jgi:hypothetical protein
LAAGQRNAEKYHRGRNAAARVTPHWEPHFIGTELSSDSIVVKPTKSVVVQ